QHDLCAVQASEVGTLVECLVSRLRSVERQEDSAIHGVRLRSLRILSYATIIVEILSMCSKHGNKAPETRSVRYLPGAAVQTVARRDRPASVDARHHRRARTHAPAPVAARG